MPGKVAKREPLGHDKQVRSLKPEDKTYEHAIQGTVGLRIRVHASGRKVWFFRCRNRQTQRLEKLTLGRYPDISLAEARREAERQRQIADEFGSARQHQQAQQQHNLQEIAEQLKARSAAGYRVKNLVREFLQDKEVLQLRSYREVARCLDRYVNPIIGDLAVEKVVRADIKAVLAQFADTGKLVQSNRVLAHLHRLFNWAIQEERIPTNPCATIKRAKEVAKIRALPDSEIRLFLNNLPESGIDAVIADIYRLILLTGLRPGETAGLARGNIDWEDRLITLPKTKSDSVHTVPVSDQVLTILTRRREASDSEFLFPLPSHPGRHLRPDSLSKPLRTAIEKLGIKPATPHDLRRSFATGIAQLGAPGHLIPLLLNHAVFGVTKIYNRYSYHPELRAWLQKWGDHVQALS